jgi:hypothetical protein
MTDVLVGHVRSALRELSDARYQSRVWTGKDPGGAMSSLDECVAELFDDSGLDSALDAGQIVFNPKIDQQLKALGDLLVKLADTTDPLELLSHPWLQIVRRRSAVIAREIDELPPVTDA